MRKLPIELTYGLTLASPVLVLSSPSVVEVLGGRDDRRRLGDCVEVDLARGKN